MAAGKKQQQQQEEDAVAAAATEPPSVARRLWRVVRAVLYMLRRGLPSGRKLAMDIHLLLHRGKIAAGKALGDRFLASHHGHGTFSYASGGASVAGPFSCGALDPSLAVHEPSRRRREVEFSCSNTPSSASGGGGLGLLGAAARRRRRRRSSRQQQHRDEAEASNGYLMQYYSGYDAAEVARVLEMLSDEDDGDDRRLFSDDAVPVPGASFSATPSQVDRRADEFIRRFYEQLRAQRSATSTPDYYGYAASGASPSPYGAARAPRAVTAGIA